MRRAVIIGPGGAGKSELAVRLSERTNLPVVHLDPIFWRADWEPAPREEAERDLRAAVAGPEWILDGNFLINGGDSDPRFERADTVIFLDLPRRTCLWRIFTRLVRDRGRSRPDLPEESREQLDWEFVRWVWSYRRRTRPTVLRMLDRLRGRVAIYHLRSRSQVAGFLDAL